MSNTDLIKRFLELQYAGELDRGFDECAVEDFWWVVGSDGNAGLNAAIPWAGVRHHGRAGYLGFTRMLYGEFDVEDFSAHHFAEAGDRVYVEGHFRFRHKSTGRVADSDFLARFVVTDGRIAGGQFYENTFGVAAARQIESNP